MATFSTNQARQLYVAKEYKTPAVIASDKAGAIAVKGNKLKNELYFQYMGAGGQTRSDLITVANITEAKVTPASALVHKLARYELTLDNKVNGGVPVAGQDYILKVLFRQFIGLSEEDLTIKVGMVHASPSMTASDFYKTLAISLAKNFAREPEQLLKFYVGTASAFTEVTPSTKESTLTDTYTKLVIEEAPQDWQLGTFEQLPVYFTLLPDQIKVNGEETFWGKVTKVASTNEIKDGKKIADLEWFCMGERGDMYRQMGYPNYIRTTYLVDPTLEYNVIDIHYSYVGDNESVLKSEKQLTIVAPALGDTSAAKNKLTNDIVGAINSATGLAIATLPTT